MSDQSTSTPSHHPSLAGTPRVRRAFLDDLGVRPDPFQLQAMDGLDAGRSVLVMAPTGAGKTFVADYAVARSLDAGTTAVYTTPLKALSNQKYRDLSARLGPGRVGLITGDRTVNAGAPVLVVTTEVLRAMLYEVRGTRHAPGANGAANGAANGSTNGRPASGAAALDRLGVVVLDEFHYLQDTDRGAVWEEVVINTPADVALVCLSATIPDVGLVHDWLTRVHGPTELVVADQRPVKLNHLYAVGNLRRTAPMLLPVFVDGQLNTTAELLDGARRDTRGEGLRARDRDRPVPPTRHDLIAHLRANNLLPAIWFVLSRAGCDEAVADGLAGDLQLTTEAERVRIRSLVSQALAPLSGGELRAIDAAGWQNALEAGIAAHHGGLAPVQRDVVEAAFGEGLVKVAFATETLALGVNLPARTVVIDRVVRAGGEVLDAGEFAQLAGRAGRRGIDEVGHVVVPWSPYVPFQRVGALAGGHLAAIRSAFRVTPAMALNLVRTGTLDEAYATVESSLRHRCALDQAAILRGDLAERQAELAEVDEDLVDVAEFAESPEPGGHSEPGQDADPHDPAERTDPGQELAGLRPGDVVVDTGRPEYGPAVVLAVGTKRGTVCVEAIHSSGRRLQLTPSTLRGGPAVLDHLDLPDWEPTRRGHAKRAVDALALLDLPLEELRPATSHGPRPKPKQAMTRRRLLVRRDQLTATVEDLQASLAEARTGVRTEFDRVLALLVRRRHLVNRTLTPSGQAIRRLFYPSGLLLGECLVAGLLDDLDPASLASAASWFTTRTRLGGPASTGLATAELTRRWETVRAITREVQADEIAEGLTPTPHPEPALGVPLHRWASGLPLDVAVGGSGVLVGDVVREIRQVAELLDQLATVPGGHQQAAAEAVVALRRGAVVADDTQAVKGS
ncbi:DEAD/DEAH box helicase [Actinopolymorpha rutila]|uniref:ATP-dependent RNA helicase HelY n=1 Tax=Actinopolymorpha rutila TaxID=446787 RepID=A0A852ZGM9_9ACTN|nr:DEAD/DEAH box helicase [Actinopolymorpha rutila]NYH92247.1 ATP-dependent RNA helicase HelY [Actinopolymorpha rutila]